MKSPSTPRTLKQWPRQPAWFILTGLWLAICLGATSISAAEGPEIPAPDGPTLAANVRNLVPEATEVQGTLIIRRGPAKRVRLPIFFKTEVGENSWRASYEVKGTNGTTLEKLSVVHHLDSTNQYHWDRTSAVSTQRAASPGDTMASFADSDFWLADLGLEFLHWPQQRLLKDKNGMRKSRYCRVLESTNPDPKPGAYATVVSWIDHEYGGVILAEAYDTERNLVKSFEIDGVTEVNDQWQLKAMKITDHRLNSRTQIEFNYQSKAH